VGRYDDKEDSAVIEYRTMAVIRGREKETWDMEKEMNDINQDDLMSIPYIGRLLMLLRGIQRPLWGFTTLYIDLQVFSKGWRIEPESVEGTVFLAINVLVLAVLFGERAVKNILPVVMKLMGLKNGQNKSVASDK
jgi:hypothetical protein